MLIASEALPHFENQIYLPMLLTILSRDREAYEKGSFKFNGLYIKLIDRALDGVQADLKVSSEYLRANKMKLIKGESQDNFTTYTFVHQGYDHNRRYLNARLKNRTEELLELYLRNPLKDK